MMTNKKTALTWAEFRYWLPAIFMAGLIFFFSSQPGEDSSKLSGSLLHQILLILSQLLPSDPSASSDHSFLEFLEFLLRKTAHVTEYVILYLTVLFGLSPRRLPRKKWALTAFVITVLYACTDEFHQYFVPDRAARITDVMIDSIGTSLITLALLISSIWKKER